MELFHLFNISSGHRFHVEISLQWKVRQLQETVVQVTGIQIDDQVLLKHSGEVIKCEETICNCCPENAVDAPVYLFQRSGKHDKQDSRMWEQEIKEITSIIDVSMENANQLLQAPDMHQICHDVPHRASECRLAAQNAVQACARIAEEHRLMLQGWVALVNNMDSSVASLRKRASRLLQQMEKVHQGKKEAFDMLRNFDKTIDQLKRIRVPENLLSCSHGSAEPSVVSDISLYGWIAASDPEHSLKELVDQVTEQLVNFQQTNMKSALQNIEKVMEMSKNINCREIKGMNMRLSYLEQHLQYAEDRSKIVEMHTSEILNTSSRVDQFSLEDFIFQYRHYMGQVYDDLKEIRLVCNHFLQSKLELLRIMRTRLDSWIVRVYNRLHHAHNELLMFEEKCTGLKQRLDLLEQVKEAPVMYATAVTEIVRRRTFQREFNSWFSVHVNKCCSLYDEETRIRAEFSTKMEKHFLRVLFHGMFDTIPPFFVKSLPEFDTALSPINDQYLKELRNQNIEELNQYLNVAPPQVFLRLDVRDPLTQAAAVSRSVLPREESSITVSPAFSLPLQSCNFFSTNWLSADDVNDCFSSTTPLMLMTKSQSRAESLASLNVPIPPSLNQLSMPGGEDELILTSASTSITTTAPIAIPVSRRRQTSSRFSTPDNQFHTADLADERQFVIDDLTIRSHSSYELLKHVTAEIIALSKEMLELRSDVSSNTGFFNNEFMKLKEMTSYFLNDQISGAKGFYEAKLAEVRKEHEKVVASPRKKESDFEELRRRCEMPFRDLDKVFAEKKRVEPISIKHKSSDTQTSVGLTTMDRMVSIEDINEGSTVLVIWNDRHKAYMLFSSSAYSHFVKESSVRRLGLATAFPSLPRRNWILGKVSHLDLCVIRKADNRYNLPVETKVYRVDVDPLDVQSKRVPAL